MIGLTASNGNALASCPANEDVAYAAGCVVVVYNAAANSQTSFYTSSKANKAIASVAYSQSGRFLAAGEVRRLSLTCGISNALQNQLAFAFSKLQ